MLKKVIVIALILVFALSVTACGAAEQKDKEGSDKKTSDIETKKPDAEMKMLIGDEEVQVDWEETDAVSALKKEVQEKPLTIEMSKYDDFEQVGELGISLPPEDEKIKTEAGDIMLYSGDKMVVFYGSNTWDYTRLGKIKDKSAEELTKLLGQDDVTITLKTDDVASNDKDTMVIYFSVTGNTKAVADRIAQLTDATVYQIEAKEPYTDKDIDYNDESSRAATEQNDQAARPAFAGKAPSLKGVKTVYLGYPIWFGQEPRIMDTFVEAVDFEGITVIPFCTSGSSDIGGSGKNLEQNAGSGKWLRGQRFDANVSEDELQSWIDSLQ